MLTIADSFDAITSKIPYNKVKTKEKAIEETKKALAKRKKVHGSFF